MEKVWWQRPNKKKKRIRRVRGGAGAPPVARRSHGTSPFPQVCSNVLGVWIKISIWKEINQWFTSASIIALCSTGFHNPSIYCFPFFPIRNITLNYLGPTYQPSLQNIFMLFSASSTLPQLLSIFHKSMINKDHIIPDEHWYILRQFWDC